MKVLTVSKYFFSVVLFTGMLACKDSQSIENPDLITGKWNVYSTEINNKQSRNMENAFFEFYSNGTVASNIFDDSNAYRYDIQSDRLIIKAPEPMQLTIKNLSRDSMQLEGTLRVFYMRFFLTKEQNL